MESTPDPAQPEESPRDDAPADDDDIGWAELLRRIYLTIDRRTLGFTRILLGAYLILDLFRRKHDWLDMFSNDGILPSHVSLFRPQGDNFSLFHAFATPGELWLLWAFGLCAYLALLVGYKTKVAQIVSLVFVASMNGRVLLIENGGYVIQNLLLLWTCFMPMGDRFSIDAMQASMARRREGKAEDLADRAAIDEPFRAEPVITLAMLAVLLQLAALYFFNVVHKTGPAWKDGTAVHYVLYNDRMATPFVPFVRDYLPLPLVLFLTKTTMVFEAALPVCLLSPIAVPWARRAVVFMMCTLHIAFGTTFTLGPFAWACCIFSTLMFSRDDWELAASTMRRAHRARVVLVREGSPVALFFGRVVARMDRFELLTFRAEPTVTGLFAVERIGGARVEGGRALSELLAALPGGPIVAWIPRLPALGALADALVAALGGARVERWLALPSAGEATLVVVPPTPFAGRLARLRFGFRELLVALMLAAAVNQALVELWVARPLHAGQPEPLRSLAHKLRFLQGWFMFSPNPVMDDGIVICDAETQDGRTIDPFSGKAPLHNLGGEVQYNQIWQDYMNRIQLPQNAFYRDALKAWLLKYHERTGRPEDRIVAARVVWAHDLNPRLGSTVSTNYEERELLAFDTRSSKSAVTP
jgi:hypothetical protein